MAVACSYCQHGDHKHSVTSARNQMVSVVNKVDNIQVSGHYVLNGPLKKENCQKLSSS